MDIGTSAHMSFNQGNMLICFLKYLLILSPSWLIMVWLFPLVGLVCFFNVANESYYVPGFDNHIVNISFFIPSNLIFEYLIN